MTPRTVLGATCGLVSLALLHGCAIGTLAKTSRYAFSPPLSGLVKENQARAPAAPIAQHYSYAWQNVEQELTEGMRIDESQTLVGVYRVPGNSALAAQAQRRADNLSEQSRVHSRLADNAKSGGNRSYHRSMAMLNADQAIAQQEQAIAAGRTEAALGLANAGFALFSSLASAGKAMNDRNYGLISRSVVQDMNAVGEQAPAGSELHLEYHFGIEPSKGKQFQSGMTMMFGGDTDQINAFMVTAVLTLPDGRRITATRLAKMIWYAGEGNLARAFPAGYEEDKILELPKVEGVDPQPLPYWVVNQLARAAVADVGRRAGR